MNSNTNGYSRLLISGIFIMVLFLITGLLSLSANFKTDEMQAVISSSSIDFNRYYLIPCNTLSASDTIENIDLPEFLIEPEPPPEPEPEIEIPTEIIVQAREPEIVYVGRIPYDYSSSVPESDTVGDDYFKDALFIGDSRTVGLFNYGGIESYFYAKVSLTIRGVMTTAFIEDTNSGEVITRTIMDTVKMYPQFKKVYIAFGLNELGWDANLFINTYEYVIEQLLETLPDVQIYIQQIIPVTKAVSDVGKNSVRNDTIHMYNDMLLELAEKKQVFYLGVAEIFEDENGSIPDDVSWDGIHLNVDSCKKQMEYVRTHVVDFETTYLRPDEEPVTKLVYPED